ncbi:MAG: RsmD family RNA methyltransferase, partial [Bacteroidia bacterium]|nr:RsmD family RNA methyltransferase [Bacteroidia bacterium]
NKYYFDELSVLDLFAGTGSISYEFASRGAENIIAIDQAQGCVNFIKKTTAELDMPINVFKSNAFTYLENLTLQFDIIFADPPYNFSDDQFARISELVFERSLLANEGLLVIEHSKHTVLSNLDFYRYSKSYGGNVFSFFTLE